MIQVKTKIIFAVGIVLACVIRICQLLFMTETATGFYKTEYQSLGSLLTVLYIAIFAVTAIISFAEMRGTVRMPGRTPVTSAVSFIAAAVMAFQLFTFSVPEGQSAVLTALNLILLIGTILFFIADGAAPFFDIDRTVSYLGVIPVVYWTVRILTVFMQYIRMANISENLFDLAAMGFVTVFFLLYGKVDSDIELKRSVRFLAPIGLCAIMLCVICTVPRYFVILVSEEQILHDTVEINPVFIPLAAFILLKLPRSCPQE